MICWNRLTTRLPPVRSDFSLGPDLKYKGRLETIQAALTKVPDSGLITVLPDYFVDRFLRVENFEELAKAIKGKGEEGGGGSIRGVRQSELKGGNAVNLA